MIFQIGSIYNVFIQARRNRYIMAHDHIYKGFNFISKNANSLNSQYVLIGAIRAVVNEEIVFDRLIEILKCIICRVCVVVRMMMMMMMIGVRRQIKVFAYSLMIIVQWTRTLAVIVQLIGDDRLCNGQFAIVNGNACWKRWHRCHVGGGCINKIVVIVVGQIIHLFRRLFRLFLDCFHFWSDLDGIDCGFWYDDIVWLFQLDFLDFFDFRVVRSMVTDRIACVHIIVVVIGITVCIIESICFIFNRIIFDFLARVIFVLRLFNGKLYCLVFGVTLKLMKCNTTIALELLLTGNRESGHHNSHQMKTLVAWW